LKRARWHSLTRNQIGGAASDLAHEFLGTADTIDKKGAIPAPFFTLGDATYSLLSSLSLLSLFWFVGAGAGSTTGATLRVRRDAGLLAGDFALARRRVVAAAVAARARVGLAARLRVVAVAARARVGLAAALLRALARGAALAAVRRVGAFAVLRVAVLREAGLAAALRVVAGFFAATVRFVVVVFFVAALRVVAAFAVARAGFLAAAVVLRAVGLRVAPPRVAAPRRVVARTAKVAARGELGVVLSVVTCELHYCWRLLLSSCVVMAQA
jgi:hypothetical protein